MPPVVTFEMLYNEVRETKQMLESLLKRETEKSIEEISLNKAAKLMKLGPETIIDLVEKGKLHARTYRDKNRKKRYRFRISDIKSFQDGPKPQLNQLDIEPTESICKRIFG